MAAGRVASSADVDAADADAADVDAADVDAADVDAADVDAADVDAAEGETTSLDAAGADEAGADVANGGAADADEAGVDVGGGGRGGQVAPRTPSLEAAAVGPGNGAGRSGSSHAIRGSPSSTLTRDLTGGREAARNGGLIPSRWGSPESPLLQKATQEVPTLKEGVS